VSTHRKGYVNFFGLHVGACQVHARLKPNRPLAKLDHLRREFGSASAGMPVNGSTKASSTYVEDSTPSDVDELRAEESHAFNTIDEVLQALFRNRYEEIQNGIPNATHLSCSRREILERPPGPLFSLCLLNLLGYLHDG
jgi:hypothetical protein